MRLYADVFGYRLVKAFERPMLLVIAARAQVLDGNIMVLVYRPVLTFITEGPQPPGTG